MRPFIAIAISLPILVSIHGLAHANDVVDTALLEENLPALQDPLSPNAGRAAIGFYNLGNTLAEEGRVEAAIAAYQEAIRLNPHNADAYYNLGYWLAVQNQPVAAENAYWQASRLNPFDADIYYNLGLVLKAQAKSEAAEVAFRRAQLLSHDNAALQSTLINLIER